MSELAMSNCRPVRKTEVSTALSPEMTVKQGKQLLLRAGDIETNPGPTGRRSVAQGPPLDEQVFNLNTQVARLFYYYYYC